MLLKDIIEEIQRTAIATDISNAVEDTVENGGKLNITDFVKPDKDLKNTDDDTEFKDASNKLDKEINDLQASIDDITTKLTETVLIKEHNTLTFMAGFLSGLANIAIDSSNIRQELNKYINHPEIKNLMSRYKSQIKEVERSLKVVKQRWPHMYK